MPPHLRQQVCPLPLREREATRLSESAIAEDDAIEQLTGKANTCEQLAAEFSANVPSTNLTAQSQAEELQSKLTHLSSGIPPEAQEALHADAHAHGMLFEAYNIVA